VNSYRSMRPGVDVLGDPCERWAACGKYVQP
jgi:hypothetical protein